MGIPVRNDVLQSDHIAIADDKGNKITYRELARTALRVRQNLEERSLIFLLCDHEMETVEFIYEILYLDMVPLLLAKDIDEELLEKLVRLYGPQFIYCSHTHEIRSRYSSCVTQWENHILLRTGEEGCSIHRDVALLLSTSGTTGSAKLVKLSYRNLYDNAEAVCRQMGICGGQKGLSPLPLNYTYGFSFCLWHWHCGATLLLTEELVFSKQFFAFYVRERVNNFAATPYVYKMLRKVQFWDGAKTEYLHFAACGGAKLAEEDQKELISVMADKFWILYGQTECTCVISGTNFVPDYGKAGSVGKVFDGMEAFIDDTTNELIINGSSVCMGYAHNRSQLADGDVNMGSWHTGDVADRDEDGFLYLRGRLTRYVKLLDKRISLDDMEKYLEEKYPGSEVACMGTDEGIQVFHTASKEGITLEIPALLHKSMKIPHQFTTCFYVDKIPRNSAGKIMYAELKSLKVPVKY